MTSQGSYGEDTSNVLAFDFSGAFGDVNPLWSPQSVPEQVLLPTNLGDRVTLLEGTAFEQGSRIERLERHVFGTENWSDDTFNASRSSVSPPGTTSSTTTATVYRHRCPMGECINRTGVDDKSPARDVARHVRSRMHVEAALKLKSNTIHDVTGIDYCSCVAREEEITVDIAAALGVQRNRDIVAFFQRAAAHNQLFCAHKTCLRVVSPATAAALDALVGARRQAVEFLSSFVFSSDGSRKRRRHALAGTRQGRSNGSNGSPPSSNGSPPADAEARGDQTVAVEFAAARFNTPGVCYLVFDAERSQLRVQRERPANAPFHIAHVARMHRWMEHVVHFAPRRHQFWNTHVAVADSGFVDAFVLVHPRLAVSAEFDAETRRALYERIVSEDVVLCAGRSDGWLELVRACDLTSDTALSHLIPLALSHLQPHSFRLYDPEAQPTLPLISEASANAVAPTLDIRMAHFAPQRVATTSLKLEFLCKVRGWQLVVAGAYDDAALAYQRCVVDKQEDAAAALSTFLSIVELEAESQLALDAAAARKCAIEALSQAEALRVANIALKQTLADAERNAHSLADRKQHALIDHNNRLQAELAAAKEALACAQASSAVATAALGTATATATTTAAAAAPAAPTRPTAAPASPPTALRLPPIGPVVLRRARPALEPYMSTCQSRAEVERELSAGALRFALYGKADTDQLRLCVRLANGSFAHSKISTRDGRFACVREISAPSLEALLFDELGLENAK